MALPQAALPAAPRDPLRWLPQSLVGRVYALYATTLVLFMLAGLVLFYQYEVKSKLEEANLSALMLTEVTAQTIAESAVIGDYDTINRTLGKAILRSPFSVALFIDMDMRRLRVEREVSTLAPAPGWLVETVQDQLGEVNRNIGVGGRDYGVLRLVFDADYIASSIWRAVQGVLALLVLAVATGVLLIWFPLRKWLGTLDRALLVGRSSAPEQEPEAERLLAELPLEFQPMVLALNQTTATLRAELQARQQALASLREILDHLQVEKGEHHAAPSEDAADHLTALTATVAHLVAEREISREASEQARDAAEAANRAKSEFLANMSHEIRTPMNAILGMAQLLDTDELRPEQRRDSVKVILRSGKTLMALLNDILDLSKVEAGKFSLQDEILLPARLLQETRQLFDESARRKGIALTLDVALGECARYRGDAMRVAQMLANLVGNAIKFTDQGLICVAVRELRRSGGNAELEFSVRDTGVGVPAEKMGQLFQSFSQVDGAASRHFGGTGLGLAIVSKLAQMMRGSVGAESEHGQGSRFWFRICLPALDDAPMPEAGVADARPAMAPPKLHADVLIADDNADNRKLIQSMLLIRGVRVHVFEDGADVLTALTGGMHVDMALIDVRMPRMDGLAAARHIRERESAGNLRRVPIIAMTANAYAEDHAACRDAGMDDVLVKPFKISELNAILQQWLPPDAAFTASGSQPVPVATPRAMPDFVPDVQETLQELLPLLDQQMFDAFAVFRGLRSALADTALAAQVAQIGHQLDALDFPATARALRTMAEAQGWRLELHTEPSA